MRRSSRYQCAKSITVSPDEHSFDSIGAMISLRTAAQAVLLVIASSLLILLSPPPPESQRSLICAEANFIGPHAHILVNCDAESFVRLAQHPSLVFEPRSMRQTRPGYAALGWTFSWPFKWMDSRGGNSYYAGYVALNIVLMILMTMMLASFIEANSLIAPAAIVPTAILLVNHITKAFTWTPHQQIMGLFISMLAIFLARTAVKRESIPGALEVFAGGLLLGLACLVYGGFLLVPASMIAARWMYRRDGHGHMTLLALSTLAVMAIPLIAWRSLVIAKTGSFYSHETQYYHEFVWITERLRDGTLAAAATQNAAAFAGTFPRALAVPVAFLVAVNGIAIARGGTRTQPRMNDSIRASIAFLIVAIVFYALMGFYDPRLTATLIPPLIVIVGQLTRESLSGERPGKPKWLPEPLTIAAIGYVALVILLPGPYA
jgi:hypothetical protein